MPLYEYQCTECEANQTAMRSIQNRDDSPLCEKCGAPTKKLISAPTTIFNGPGFPGNDGKITQWASDTWKQRSKELGTG